MSRTEARPSNQAGNSQGYTDSNTAGEAQRLFWAGLPRMTSEITTLGIYTRLSGPQLGRRGDQLPGSGPGPAPPGSWVWRGPEAEPLRLWTPGCGGPGRRSAADSPSEGTAGPEPSVGPAQPGVRSPGGGRGAGQHGAGAGEEQAGGRGAARLLPAQAAGLRGAGPLGADALELGN